MIINYSDFSKIKKLHDKQTIVFCSGSFDMTHSGHVLFLEDCKELGDVLVVGVGSDPNLKLKGKGRPILNEHVRLKMIDSLKPVDYTFIHNNHKPDPLFNNSFLEEVFPELRPHIWVINTDASEIPFRKKLAKKYGLKLVILKRKCPPAFEDISTTGIIDKIRSLDLE